MRGYEDRIDLLSVMIAGPTKTPYEGGLFVFDVQLGGEYPRAPPLCHYHSYCTDRLNPNLYEDGKVWTTFEGGGLNHHKIIISLRVERKKVRLPLSKSPGLLDMSF